MILGIQTRIPDLKLNVEVQKQSVVPKVDVCIVTRDFECPKINTQRYTINFQHIFSKWCELGKSNAKGANIP